MSKPSPFGRGKKDLSESQLTLDEKSWLGESINNGSRTALSLSKQFNLKIDTLQSYARKLRNGLTLHESGGRPPKLTSDDKQIYKEIVTHAAPNLSTSEASDILQNMARHNESNRRHVSPELADGVSPRTVRNVNKELGLQVANAETTTNARIEAESDLRNAISFAAANHLMVPLVNRHLILNMDATQFRVGSDTTLKTKAVYSSRHPITGQKQKQKVHTKPLKGRNGIVSYYIKFYLIMSAGGYPSTPVFVVQDESMTAETIDAHSIPGLGLQSGTDNHGWLVFCKSRAGNLEFFKWINLHVVVPFVQNIKAMRGLTEPSLTWFVLDGEPAQIELYNHAEVLKILEDNEIVVGKLPASTTAITQPADVGNCFIGSKTVSKLIGPRDYEDQELKDSISQAIKTHNKSFKPTHKSLLVDGLQRIRLALETSLKPTTIMDSFQKSGIFCKDTQSYSLTQILKEFKCEISSELLGAITSAMPSLAKLIGAQGELLSADFTRFGISGSDKDSLVLHRRRMVILTNRKLIEREEEKRRLKEETGKGSKRKKVNSTPDGEFTSTALATSTHNRELRNEEIPTFAINTSSLNSDPPITPSQSVDNIVINSIQRTGRLRKKPRHLDD
jgi:hypothetical protein